ncbi:uncharacterized protein LOC112043591 [Bicyclus anynana]|uniref:Gustatory receptor n=1 Tax=Bicyclus anynana TaxID=110368 RepID=A0A6J1MPL2_BICAN|nr:uncharacterized protein LOC112043591 [Bicyclus anynana]
MKPIYIVASLFGLFPYRIKFQDHTNYFIINRKSVYVNSLCGISVVLVALAFLALHIQDVFVSSENVSMTEVIMTQINYVLELVSLVVFCAVAYTSVFLNRAYYLKILNTLTTTWYDTPPNRRHQNILSRLKFQVNFVAMGSLVTVVILQVAINFTRDNSLWKMILVAMTFNLAQIIQFVTLALYYVLVMLVVALLNNINEHCSELVRDKRSLSDGVIKVKPKHLVTLRQMELAYVKAFEMKSYINEAFQGPILATAIQCFHSMVSEAHIIYHGIVVERSLTTHDVINCSIWIVYQILKIYLLAYAGNLLKLEALRIGQTLHNIPTDNQDLRWLLEIQHFSSLMSYQRIEMTVYEYFPLDATLMYNMVASATMYLIILVQFDKKI